MEKRETTEPVNDQSLCPAPTIPSSSKLRYPLRSSARLKEGKPEMADPSILSASKRGRPSPAISRSMNVLDLSGKGKSAEPPRRLSIPTRSAASSHPTPAGNITPISETRAKRSNTQQCSDTPVSDVQKSMSRRKFCVITSVSYWLTQIRLSESASKHSISLGFFKLALDSGCESLDRVREELKSYVRRHNLVTELGEPLKDLLQSYNITEDLDKLSISDNKSPKEAALKLEKNAHSFSSMASTGNLKPKSLNSITLAAAAENLNKKDSIQKKQPASRSRRPNNKKTENMPVKDTSGNNTQKKYQGPRKEYLNGNEKIKKSQKKSTVEKGDTSDPLPTETASYEDKENMEDGHLIEGASNAQEIQTS